MVFLVLTRHAVADLSDLATGKATAVWVNSGVLSDEEVAQMQAGGIDINVLPRVLDQTMPGEIQRLVEETRRSHGGTIWVEHPAKLPEAPQPREASAADGAPALPSLPSSFGKTRSVSGWTLRQLRRFSASDGSAKIFTYMGFGTAEHFVLLGRVMKDKGFRPPSETRSAWRNFFELYKHIDSREIPGAGIVARFGDTEQQAVADNNGYFRLEFKLAEPLETSGWHEVELELVNPPKRGASAPVRAQVLVPPSSARFGVISDIDDTVLWSNVTNKLKMLRMLAVTNAHTRRPFKGVTAFYCALRDGLSGNDGNPSRNRGQTTFSILTSAKSWSVPYYSGATDDTAKGGSAWCFQPVRYLLQNVSS